MVSLVIQLAAEPEEVEPLRRMPSHETKVHGQGLLVAAEAGEASTEREQGIALLGRRACAAMA